MLPNSVQINAEVQQLEVLSSSPSVIVVGAGYAGVELAATMAERLPSATVQIINTGTMLPLHAVQTGTELAWALHQRVFDRACSLLMQVTQFCQGLLWVSGRRLKRF